LKGLSLNGNATIDWDAGWFHLRLAADVKR
jgi:hypothetical protein